MTIVIDKADKLFKQCSDNIQARLASKLTVGSKRLQLAILRKYIGMSAIDV